MVVVCGNREEQGQKVFCDIAIVSDCRRTQRHQELPGDARAHLRVDVHGVCVLLWLSHLVALSPGGSRQHAVVVQFAKIDADIKKEIALSSHASMTSSLMV